MRLALAPVARNAGPIVDERELLPDEPVEQRRFTDIGAADDRDDGEVCHRRLLTMLPICATRGEAGLMRYVATMPLYPNRSCRAKSRHRVAPAAGPSTALGTNGFQEDRTNTGVNGKP